MSVAGSRPEPATARPARVGVAGLGAMGGSIAALVSAGGFEVIGYDPAPEAIAAAVTAGARPARSVGELATRAEVLIASLPAADALGALVADVVASPGGVQVVVEASTLALEDKEDARERLAAAGVDLLDCPISGTAAQLRAGDAAVYASGEAASLRYCLPVLSSFARQVIDAGPFGNGTRLKLVANLLVAVHNVAAAEAIALAERSGLDPALALEALTSGAGSSRMLEVRGPMMLERSYRPAPMRVRLFAKDLQLIDAFARDCGARTPLLDASRPLYEAASRLGHDDSDTASVFETLLGS